MVLPGISAALFTTACWLAAQIAFLGFVPHRCHLRVRLFLYALSLASFFIWQWSTSWLNLLNGALLHLLFFCTFMEFYYCVDRPITLRILVETKKEPEQKLNPEKLYQSYPLEYMIQRRLEALTACGYLLEREGYYHLTPKGRFFAKIFEYGSRLFGVDRWQ